MPVLPGWAVWAGVALVLAALMLLPLVSVQMRALTGGGSSYAKVLTDPTFASTLWSTLLLGAGSVIIAVIFGTSLAWCSTQLPSGLRWVSMLPLLPIMVPAVAVVTGWAFLLSPQTGYINVMLRKLPWWETLERGPINVYSEFWIVVITGTLLISFVYLFTQTALQSMDGTLIEAARTSGANAWMTWMRVLLPLLRPSILHSSVIVLLLGLGQFTAPLLLGRDANVNVLTTEMYRGAQTYPIDYGMSAAFGSPLIVVGVLLIIIQRRGLKDAGRFQSLGVRGHRGGSRRQAWFVVPIIGYVGIAVALPIFALLNVALSPFYTGSLVKPNEITFDNVTAVLAEPGAQQAILNSVLFSVGALIVILPLGYLIATALCARAGQLPRFLRSTIDMLTSVPLVMPGVLFGAGILFAYSEGPVVLYGTGAAVVLAYVTIMIPHVARMLESGLIGSGQTLSDAARVHGATALRTHLRISIPLLRPAFTSATAITFSILTHEFSASTMVRSTETEVMGTLLLKYWTLGSYPNVAVMALIMCVVTTVLVGGSYAFGGRKSLGKS